MNKILWPQTKRFIFASLTLVLLCIAMTLFGPASIVHASSPSVNAKEIIIVNPNNKSDNLSLNQARAIFSLRARKWPDGSRITVLVLQDHNPTHVEFLQGTLKILPHQLRRHWDRYIYSGTGQGPVVVKTQQQMIEMVNKIPGAIGYVEKGVPHEQVLTLTIH